MTKQLKDDEVTIIEPKDGDRIDLPPLPEDPNLPPWYRHMPTPDSRMTVRYLSMAGRNRAQIAKLFDIHAETLETNYKEDLTFGEQICVRNVAKCLYDKAVIDKDLAAMIFFLKGKAKALWGDQAKLELTGADGTPLFQAVIESTPLTAQQWIEEYGEKGNLEAPSRTPESTN